MTEVELARREGREYEPAGVLLERVRAERAAAGSAKRGRRPAGVFFGNGRSNAFITTGAE